MDGAARLRRLGRHVHVLTRLFRFVEVATAVLLLSWSSSRVPSIAAAFVRLSAALLLDPRFVFVLGNAIVFLLLFLSRHDDDVKPNSNTTTTVYSDLQHHVLSAVLESTPEKEVVFEDKEAVRVEIRPTCRRSQSEKMETRKKSPPAPESLRRSQSENGRRRRKAAEKDSREEDAEAFRRMIEEFIAKQTKFHREESMAIVPASDGGGGEKPVSCSVTVNGALEAATTVLK